MRAALLLLLLALAGCIFFDEPGLREDDDDDDEETQHERVDCFADLPDEAASELLPGFCTRRNDFGLDGVIDAEWTFEYDAERRPRSLRIGAMVTRYDRDDAGNLLLTETDIEGDGIADAREQRGYDCFDEEEPEPVPGPCSIEIDFDFDADGVIDSEQLLHYEDGRLVQERNSMNGRVLSVVDYGYDDDGRLETKRWDTLNDGHIDAVTSFGYDDDGHRIYERTDSSNDGTIDVSTEYVVQDGWVVREESFQQGRVVSTIEYERDAQGRVILETLRYGAESAGIVTERRFDRAGNLLAEATFDNRSHGADACLRYEYDCF